jgi:hypothetical protein
MFSFDRLAQMASAAFGALLLSTLTVFAAVGPAETALSSPAVYASAETDVANV